jgi:hypothetical protein
MYPKKETIAHMSPQFAKKGSSHAKYFYGQVSHVLKKYLRGCREAFG